METLCNFFIYKEFFPRATVEQLVATKDTEIKLKTYKQITITQLGICTVKLDHNNKCKTCNFLVVPGNGQALLGIPDTKLLNILNISCSTISTEEEDRDANCSKNRHTIHDVGNEQHCANTVPKRRFSRSNSNMYC